MNSGQFSNGGGAAGNSGTVTSVSGTTNQIDVATGTSTPVVSLDATAILAGAPYGGTTAGSATVQTLTVPNIPATATVGTKISFISGFASTGATTLTVTPTGGSAYSAINLMKRTTSGVVALSSSGDLSNGGVYTAIYDGTQWVLGTPSSTAYTGGTLTSGSILRGNAANQVSASTGMLSTGGTVYTTYNSEVLAGVGLTYIRGVTSQKAETGTADASVLAVTPASTVGSYQVFYTASVSSATAGTIGFTLSWTDSNGNAQSNVALPLFQQGVAAPALTFTAAGAGNYNGSFLIDVNNAGAAITLKWVGGGTTAAKVSGIIERVN